MSWIARFLADETGNLFEASDFIKDAETIVTLLDAHFGSADWRQGGGASHSHANLAALDQFTLDGENITIPKGFRPGVFAADDAPADSIYIDVDTGHAMRKHEDGEVHVLDNEEGVYGEYGSGPPTCVAPTFSPVAGSYGSTQNVTISTVTSGASIKYTTDGSVPTPTNGTLYVGAVSVSVSQTLRAVAYKSGVATSAISDATYTIGSSVAAPVFSPVAGTYEGAQPVTITTATSGASIRYTRDGTIPTSTTGTLYTAPLAVTETDQIKAIAYKTAMTDSAVVSATYVISGESSDPHFVSWAANGFLPINMVNGNTLVLFVSEYEMNASEYHQPALEALGYTLVGTKNSSGGVESYEGQMRLSVYTKIIDGTETALTTNNEKMMLVQLTNVGTITDLGGYDQIGITQGQSYDDNPDPVGKSLVLTTFTSTNSYETGRDNAYVLDENTRADRPDVVDVGWSETLPVLRTKELQSSPYFPDFYMDAEDSAQGGFCSISIGATVKVQDPIISPTTGTHVGTQNATIWTPTTGASIRYTTDGSTPTSTTGTVYSGTFQLTASATVKAIAYMADTDDSEVVEEVITIVASLPTYMGSSDDGNYPTVDGGIVVGDLIFCVDFDTATLPAVPSGFTDWDSDASAFTRVSYKVAAGSETGSLSAAGDAQVVIVLRNVDVDGTDVGIAFSDLNLTMDWASASGSGDAVVCLVGSHQAWDTSANDETDISIGTGANEYTSQINNGGGAGDPLRTKMWTKNSLLNGNAGVGLHMTDLANERKIAVAISAGMAPTFEGSSDDGNYPTVSGGIQANDLIVVVDMDETTTPSTPSGFTADLTDGNVFTLVSYKVATGGETGSLGASGDDTVAMVFRNCSSIGTDIAYGDTAADVVWPTVFRPLESPGISVLVGSHADWSSTSADGTDITEGAGANDYTNQINNGGSGGDPLRSKMWTKNNLTLQSGGPTMASAGPPHYLRNAITILANP